MGVKIELYLGKYLRESRLGETMDLEKGKLFVVYPYIGVSSEEKVIDEGDGYTILRINYKEAAEPDKIILGVQDWDFWPVIIRLTPDEAKRLCEALIKALKLCEKGVEELEGQLYEEVG
ncbi:MAG: hypothetical protein DRO36_05635 [Candidatus Hecatellales archaeon]|nr:MAG: hypothetical protein DRO36_05635 [Candidatus Hecatellales archaeon]